MSGDTWLERASSAVGSAGETVMRGEHIGDQTGRERPTLGTESEQAEPLAPNGLGAGAEAEALVERLGRADIQTRAAAITQLQRSSGNRALTSTLTSALLPRLQRDETTPEGGDVEQPALTPAELTLTDAGFVPLQQGGAVGQGSQGGATGGAGAATRPAPRSIHHDCANCNEAAAFLNAGNYVGEANVQVAPAAGQIRVSGSRSAFTAEVDISWPIDVAASSMEVTDFVWPNMTDVDRSAVASFRAALLAHEEGHFVASERVIAAQPTTLSATGATQRAAVAALRTQAQQQMRAGQAALDRARDDYDNQTQHGANQAAVGGTNVHLECPRRSTGRPATP
jgi:hypothetical protein